MDVKPGVFLADFPPGRACDPGSVVVGVFFQRIFPGLDTYVDHLLLRGVAQSPYPCRLSSRLFHELAEKFPELLARVDVLFAPRMFPADDLVEPDFAAARGARESCPSACRCICSWLPSNARPSVRRRRRPSRLYCRGRPPTRTGGRPCRVFRTGARAHPMCRPCRAIRASAPIRVPRPRTGGGAAPQAGSTSPRRSTCPCKRRCGGSARAFSVNAVPVA